jgi:hypothetical protein
VDTISRVFTTQTLTPSATTSAATPDEPVQATRGESSPMTLGQTVRQLIRPAAAFGLAIAYGGGYWLHQLHEAEGAVELNAPPGLLHWLRDSTLSLPLVFVATMVAVFLARRLLARFGRDASPLVVGTVMTASVALIASVALGIGSPIHGLLFDAHEGADEDLPVLAHAGRDALLALLANLPLAAMTSWLISDELKS